MNIEHYHIDDPVIQEILAKQRKFNEGRLERCIAEGDALVFSENQFGLLAVKYNVALLLERGIYEAALFHGYTGCTLNNCHFSISELETLFNIADRKKLLAMGDPLPERDIFTIYRGVAGKRPYRKVRSYSWTLDYDRAVWFAQRGKTFGLHDPAVYRATVCRGDVLAYCNDRGEQEFICRPRSCQRVASIETLAA